MPNNVTTISLELSHGQTTGRYCASANRGGPLLIITNGHNGFYNYGMFPYLQDTLADNGLSSFSYNFSHGGIEGDLDYFTALDLYELNCMRLETQDLYEIITHLKESIIPFNESNKLILLSHSMGSIPNIFAAKRLLAEGYKIDGIVLLSPINTLNRFSPEIMDVWEKNGVHMIWNNRTKQDLPHGKELLEEVKEAQGKWDLEKAIRDVKTKFLIIHGDSDEAVPFQQSISIHEWNKDNKNESTLKIIPNATHTFNTRHPFNESTPELNSTIAQIIEWVKNIQ